MERSTEAHAAPDNFTLLLQNLRAAVVDGRMLSIAQHEDEGIVTLTIVVRAAPPPPDRRR